jgi:2-haloacid dehalogenase
MSRPAHVKALYFDVFGTVADWYSQVLTEGEALSHKTGVTIAWGEFALKWRIDGYIAALIKIAAGQMNLSPT